MDSSDSNRFDIFEIYRSYCDVRSGKAQKDVSNGPGDEAQRCKFSREALAQLLKFVETCLPTRYQN
uniref:Defective in cullin neddylation protein n=1 Tax=Rhizophora mucronata TaxID=61149 RepID=A0A2P2JPI0_RHIMU